MAVTRRKLLRLAAAGLSSALSPLGVGCAQKIGHQRGAGRLPTPNQPFTPTDDWYFVAVQGAYAADLERYRLQVGGVADRELSSSVATLREEFELVEQSITLACVGNAPNGRLLSSSWFRGVRFRDLALRAGVDSRVTGAWITGLEGFVAYQAIDDLMREESMIAVDMGPSPEAYQPLPIDNGFPCRLLTPGLYGYMQPKWIDSITFVDHGGHQQVLGNSLAYLDGKMQLASGFSAPQRTQLPAGPVELLGYAFGDGRAIAEVSVEVDGAPWQPAEVVWNDHTEPGNGRPAFLWLLWRFEWQATPGSHQLRCRASYVDGETQSEGRSFPYSGGSIAAIEVSVTPGVT
jgi:sulfite oxidase